MFKVIAQPERWSGFLLPVTITPPERNRISCRWFIVNFYDEPALENSARNFPDDAFRRALGQYAIVSRQGKRQQMGFWWLTFASLYQGIILIIRKNEELHSKKIRAPFVVFQVGINAINFVGSNNARVRSGKIKHIEINMRINLFMLLVLLYKLSENWIFLIQYHILLSTFHIPHSTFSQIVLCYNFPKKPPQVANISAIVRSRRKRGEPSSPSC